MTHIKFATLSISFYMERKANTGLPAGDNCAREVSNNYVIGQKFVTRALTYIVICNLFCFRIMFVTYVTKLAL